MKSKKSDNSDPIDILLRDENINRQMDDALKHLPVNFTSSLKNSCNKKERLTWIIIYVLTNWPDWESEMAISCPEWLLKIEAPNTPFGGKGTSFDNLDAVQTREFLKSYENWRGKLQSGSTQFINHEQMQEVARFLLYEYIHNRKLGIIYDAFYKIHLSSSNFTAAQLHPFRGLLSWAKLQDFGTTRMQSQRPNFIDKFLTVFSALKGAIVGWAAVFLWTYTLLYAKQSEWNNSQIVIASIAMFAFLTLACWLTRMSLQDIGADLRSLNLSFPETMVEDFMQRWPNGKPFLLIKPRSYVKFIEDYSAVFSIDYYDFHQWAIRRSWSSVINPNFRNVFISHSHAQANIAHALAEALKKRGLSVGLDAWSVDADLELPEVERWIVETIMSTDVMIYLVSKDTIKSAWVKSEVDWEFRLSTIKEWNNRPYMVVLDSEIDLSGYDQSRLINGVCFTKGDYPDKLLDELSLRIFADHFTKIQRIRLHEKVGLRPQWGDELIDDLLESNLV